MKLDSKIFRDAANIFLWEGDMPGVKPKKYACHALESSLHSHYHFSEQVHREYQKFFRKHFKPWFSGDIWWNVGWRFKTQADVQAHRKKMLLKAADLVDKMNAEER